jgi:N utilization substance protein B
MAEAEREIRRARRAGGRLAAIQALYQMEQTSLSVPAVIAEFLDDRLGLSGDGAPVEEADPDLFKSIVSGVVDRQDDVDRAIMRRLATGWRLERLDATSRAILRAAVFELLASRDLPASILLAEYVSIAHAFFEGAEASFINGLLDQVAVDIRGG